MFKDLYLFELRYRFGRVATWMYALIIFLLAFLLLATGSTSATEKVFHNSPLILAVGLIVLSLFGTLISSAIMGVPIYRDLEHGSYTFLFAYPIKPRTYLLARYFGSLTVLMIVPVAGLLGTWLGTLLGPVFGWEEAYRYGPNELMNYLIPFFWFSVINFLFTGTLFFAIVALTRKVMAAYAGGILFLIAYLISGIFMSDLERREIASLFDPYGLNVLSLETRYYTPFEQNTLPLPLNGVVLFNRLLWLGLSIVILLISVARFSFSSFFVVKQKKSKQKESEKIPDLSIIFKKIPRDFGALTQLKMTFQLGYLEFLSVIRDRYFKAMLLGGLIFLFIDGWFGGEVMGTPSLPSTFAMLENRNFNFGLFVWIILLFYTGEVVHRIRAIKLDGIMDALPVSNAVNFFSRFTGMAMVAMMLSISVMVVGLSVQIAKGFFDFQLLMYLKELILIAFPEYLQIVMLAFFIHVLVQHKYGGHIIGIGFWLIMFVIRGFAEIDFRMFFYGSLPNYTLSDMNGFGHFVEPIIWFLTYWTACGVLLLMIAYLFWVRGTAQPFKKRLMQARKAMKPHWLTATGLTLVVFLGAGASIYYNTRVINLYTSVKKQRDSQADYEKSFKQYARIPQPKYITVKLIANIFPYERKLNARYETQVVNKEEKAIDTLFMNIPATGIQMQWDGIALNAAFKSEPSFVQGQKMHFMKFALPKPLMPGDTAAFLVEETDEVKGFGNSDINPRLTYNGSFLNLMPPGFGYDENMELESDSERKKRGLPVKDFEMPPYGDAYGMKTLLFNSSADLVSFESVISTAEDQVAIAPGYLQKEWVENNRRYFHYKVDELVDLFYAVVSARYAIARDTAKLEDGRKVPIEIYYHPTHAYNLDRFMAGCKDALIYNSKNFSPYQFRQMRILEFPRYMSFAQSFPNTVPYSESFGWLGDFSDANDYDYAYYVTAHEIGHQWWGHQVVPNYTRGANLISESLAEYSAIMVAEHRYGKDNINQFLKRDLDRYLNGRANESKKENPFIDCNRSYQWYEKGSLIFYAIRDYIGEDSLNSALRAFANEFGEKTEGPYAGSYDLYRYVESVTPEHLRYFLNESWKLITLYDNRVLDVSVNEKGSQWEVTMKVSSQKFYADSSGKERDGIYYNDQIDVGIFAADKIDEEGRKQTVPLYLKKHAFSAAGEQSFTMLVDEKPVRVGIDPYNKLIDRVSGDNVKNTP